MRPGSAELSGCHHDNAFFERHNPGCWEISTIVEEIVCEKSLTSPPDPPGMSVQLWQSNWKRVQITGGFPSLWKFNTGDTSIPNPVSRDDYGIFLGYQASRENFSFSARQTGQRQVAGKSGNSVPGGIFS